MVHLALYQKGSSQDAGNVHRLHRSRLHGGSNAVHFAIRVENHMHIRRAYGEEGARAALAGVRHLLADMIRADGIVVPEANGELDLLIWNVAVLGPGPLPAACQAWLSDFCWLLPFLPIETPGGAIHLWISARWTIPDALMETCGSQSDQEGACNIGFCGAWPDDRADWSDRYCRDMKLVTGLLSGIISDAVDDPGRQELMLAWQPVCDSGGVDAPLYREALVRLLDRDGKIHSAGDIFLALERLGFARAVDHYVVSRIIDELEECPGIILGANISAQSVRTDAWWEQVKARLAMMPDVACRLVLEITETAGMPSGAEAALFANSMQRLGCRIALDDFGMGYASIRQVLTFSPDYVKIDKFFVWRAETCGAERDLLRYLIGIGTALGSVVIVEGVETSEQAEFVSAAGGRWQQGYHWGRPALSRSWRSVDFC